VRRRAALLALANHTAPAGLRHAEARNQGFYEPVTARVIIADRNPDALRALKTLLAYLDYDIVGEITSVDASPRVYSELQPDLVLMDWQIFKQSRANLIDYLAKQNRPPRLIIMSNNADDGRRALAAGAHAFVSKSDPADWLLEALRLVAMQDDSGEEGET
jgi:DNA-binding NarL/FixJ family response regulator